ncbi:MAG: hypothetical protein P4L11_11360 [Geothrix sp.]|nr:hypothetical protein [Geothrix sp.]
MDQLTRYAEALKAREAKPGEAWLVALRRGAWVPVPLTPEPKRAWSSPSTIHPILSVIWPL